MDSGELMKFAQSMGVSNYSEAKRMSAIRNRDEFIKALLENSDVRKKYKKSYEIEAALKSANLYYKF